MRERQSLVAMHIGIWFPATLITHQYWCSRLAGVKSSDYICTNLASAVAHCKQ